MELDTITPFTPIASLIGGILIGLSAIIVMAVFGRIAGVSGITGTVLNAVGTPDRGKTDLGWRVAFIAGLIAAPLGYAATTGIGVSQTVPGSLIGMAVAGGIVGIGTSIGSGCTSGHGVCGLARLSLRSLVAVLIFMASAMLTVFVLRHVV
ncbi:YeeE/YedE family protein [Sulfitobacter sp. F26204]|uniref:YeeE/YedE family protein n=1 Tax=Sulfitobacter sp. F26204 TaxID=2996014 RepID=UPI00225E215F|nr:YeeE/YedE family protein [Sulfitobacter sp. F26204]MCX7559758.1 YeeE/YedE family protein [Sulfitobacter sp. F26204]